MIASACISTMPCTCLAAGEALALSEQMLLHVSLDGPRSVPFAGEVLARVERSPRHIARSRTGRRRSGDRPAAAALSAMDAKYPLSPAMWRFVEHSRAFASDSPRLDAQRAAYARMCQAFAPPRPAGLRVLDSSLPAAPPVRVRRYRPDRPAPPGGWPALLYLHGGGWMLGGLDSHDFICADLAARLGCWCWRWITDWRRSIRSRRHCRIACVPGRR